MLFTFPSRYSYTIGLTGVFSLAGWARRIRTGLHVSRATQGTAMSRTASRKGLSPSMAGLSRPFRSPCKVQSRGPTTPGRPEPTGFGLIPVRSPLLGESLLFSFPAGTKMFQFPALAPHTRAVSPKRTTGCPIRKSADHRPFAPTRGFSQLTTSFFASVSLGIHHAPLLSFPWRLRLSLLSPPPDSFRPAAPCLCQFVKDRSRRLAAGGE